MAELIEHVIYPRQGGKRAAIEAKAAELVAGGWTEVTNDPDYGPPIRGVRKFNQPAGGDDD
jgi:hypothetical protein